MEEACETPTNFLHVIHNLPEDGQKAGFGVCVKGLASPGDDLSLRMLEWIEVLRALGAEKIFLYQYEVHPNVEKVLDHYQRKGEVEVTPLTLPGKRPNLPWLTYLSVKRDKIVKRLDELIPYNDCFMRNMYKFEYLAMLDIDEVILPRDSTNWSDMMAQIKESLPDAEKISTFAFQHVYFGDWMSEEEEDEEGGEIPPYLHMLRHVHRSVKYFPEGKNIKAFHDTEMAVTVHNHFTKSCFTKCRSVIAETDHGHLQHFRSKQKRFPKGDYSETVKVLSDI